MRKPSGRDSFQVHGDPPVDVHVRRSERARRMTLRVSSLDGRVTMTVPCGVAHHEVEAFANQKSGWIRAHLSKQTVQEYVGIGTKLPIFGSVREIRKGTGRRVVLTHDALHVPGTDDRVAARVLGFVKTMARDKLALASDHYASVLGQHYNGITLRDTRSRWGSCTSEKRLMYSWRLIMAPVEVLNYVAAHEVAHLEQMNHSPAFWSLVSEIYGDYAEPRGWLRRDGASLHRYRFDN